MMIRVHIICEGQTEETFCKDLLKPFFIQRDIEIRPSLIGKPGHKGGNIKFERFELDIRNRLLGDTKSFCTTFFDFYALANDFPGKEIAIKKKTIQEKFDSICLEFYKKLEAKLDDKAMWRFIPYIQMYEFEALLFSHSHKFAKGIDQPTLASHFQKIRDEFTTPEDINDSPDTAPSKRILKLTASEYQKPLHGTLAALEIGLETIRQECHLFDNWLRKIEDLNQISPP
jgi:hypothetical protein